MWYTEGEMKEQDKQTLLTMLGDLIRMQDTVSNTRAQERIEAIVIRNGVKREIVEFVETLIEEKIERG